MLINFEFKNTYSFKDKNYFSMECTKDTSFEKINTFNTNHKNIELLKSSLIYGSNASGKSNFIKALKFMKNSVLYSSMPISSLSLNNPFKFIQKNIQPSKYEIEFLIENIKYKYGFEILFGKVNSEWLYKTKERESCLFKRTSSNYEDIELFGEFKSAKNTKKMVAETSLFITVCKMFNFTIANQIWNWFYELEILTIDDQENPVETFNLLDTKPELKNKILNYLKMADIDIVDFSYEINKQNIEQNKIGDLTKGTELIEITDFKTLHKMYDANDNLLENKIELPFYEYQSDGTKKLFSLIGPIFNILECGGILIIDEIDARFHPAMVRVIISMFNSINMNTKNAQLICTTHDVLLLDEDIRRDQIWFIDKNEFSSSELYCLADFKGIRKEEHRLKKYLLGMFGAIPFENGEF